MVRSIHSVRFETLEGRRLLSGGAEVEHPVAEGLSHGLLTVRGSDANDVIKLRMDGDHLSVQKNGVVTNYAKDDVEHVIVYGGGGDDDLEADNANGQFTLGVVLIGGAGNDTLVGGAGRDYLLGNDGNDSCDGRSDADTMSGGS